MKKLLMGLVAFGMISAGASVAQATAFDEGWSLTGGFNTTYNYNFNRPAGTPGTAVNGAGVRPFITRPNNFDFNRAELELEKEVADWAKFRLDLAFGQDAAVDTLAGAGDVQQAYAELTANVGNGLTFTIGRFATIIGYEVVESFYNWNTTRSIAFANAIPFHHQGIFMSYAPSDLWNFGLGVVNSSAGASVDNNDGKAFLYQLGFTPSDAWSFSLQGSVGWDGGFVAAGAGDSGPTFLADFVLNYQPNDNWTFGLNFDWRVVKGAADSGAAAGAGGMADVIAAVAYLHWDNEAYGMTVRAEWFNDDNGLVTGVANQDIISGTLTGHIYMGEGWETRLEFRLDRADTAIYATNTGARSWEPTFTAELLYKF